MISELWVVGVAAMISIFIARARTLPEHLNTQLSTKDLLAVTCWSPSLAAFQRADVSTWISGAQRANPMRVWLNTDWRLT